MNKEISDKLAQTIQAIYSGNNEAYSKIVDLIDALLRLAERLPVSPELNNIFEKAVFAMEKRDQVMLVDILEYQLSPIFKAAEPRTE